MAMDPDVHHISKEAVEFARVGAELFIEMVSRKVCRYSDGRHSIRFGDFNQM